MGLMIHSLGELPTDAKREYYVYLLDYGWDEPLGDALRNNFSKMAAKASAADAVVIRGVVGSHFEDEVLSWHHINGQPGDGILPAILITTRHPHQFHHYGKDWQKEGKLHADRLLLIPLREVCKTTTEVADLIEKIFSDIKKKQALADFAVAREMKKGKGGAIVDALILKPNIQGVGIDLEFIKQFFKGK
ncbi:MAG: hypothetical protein AB1489_25065 [Acidobacteriota bacterium]